MDELSGKGWKHPGRRSSDYSLSENNDHDQRTFAAARSYEGVGPKGYKRRDGNIREDICEILYWHPDVDARGILVSVEDGNVFLEGAVDSRHAKKLAEDSIDKVRGIHDVFNRLSIKPTLDLESDKIITRGDEGFYSQETIPR